MRAHSRKRPTLLVVEDLHWIDASTLEFLGHFILEAPQDPILTVLTFRPEFKTRGRHHPIKPLWRSIG